MKENAMVKAALRKMKVKDVNRQKKNKRKYSSSNVIRLHREEVATDVKNNQEKGSSSYYNSCTQA